ncbi:hypothetical protein SDC9_149330 [bioreactor metagenome]|uniref:Uncharacterized protein n=1 Tax=bioreactor metagenome TaxID=1076179 RepID=A0A645EK24_9ZZZZ
MLSKSISAASLKFSKSLCFNTDGIIQSKNVLPFNTLYCDIGLFPSTPFAQVLRLFSMFLVEPVIISFSFGLVNATYKTLISSDKFSIFILLFNASLAILG